jgi:hypothetical protein
MTNLRCALALLLVACDSETTVDSSRIVDPPADGASPMTGFFTVMRAIRLRPGDRGRRAPRAQSAVFLIRLSRRIAPIFCRICSSDSMPYLGNR